MSCAASCSAVTGVASRRALPWRDDDAGVQPALVTPARPLAQLEDIGQHAMLESRSTPTVWAEWLQAAGLDEANWPRTRLSFDHVHLALNAALQGAGMALAPTSLLAELIAEGRCDNRFRTLWSVPRTTTGYARRAPRATPQWLHSARGWSAAGSLTCKALRTNFPPSGCAMLRITELKLPLDHVEAALPAAILARFAIKAEDLLGFTVFRRGYDSRKKAGYPARLHAGRGIAQSAGGGAAEALPQGCSHHADAGHFVQVRRRAGFICRRYAASDRHRLRPCGILAALILAQMGLKPIILERGKVVRERTKDTRGFWRRRELNTESNVQFGEGGAGHLQ